MTNEGSWRLFFKTGLPEAYLLAKPDHPGTEGRQTTQQNQKGGWEDSSLPTLHSSL